MPGLRLEGQYCQVMFDAGMYCPSGVHRLVDSYLRLLATVLCNPDLSIDELIARSAQDRRGQH